jgi:hypothetical protein
MDAIYSGNDFVFGVDRKRIRDERLLASATHLYQGFGQGQIDTVAPPRMIRQGVDGDTYNRYREGLVSSCADIVVTTTGPDGVHYVLAIKRAAGKCFGGSWWMMGGAVHTYRSLTDFVADRAERECGVRPIVEACMFMAYTSAFDVLASTIQPCFVGRAEWEQIEKMKADSDHLTVQLLTIEQVSACTELHLHWYPRLAFTLALETM